MKTLTFSIAFALFALTTNAQAPAQADTNCINDFNAYFQKLEDAEIGTLSPNSDSLLTAAFERLVKGIPDQITPLRNQKYSTNPLPCALNNYPRMFEFNADAAIVGTDTLEFITHVVPAANVVYLSGLQYSIKHPVAGNLCAEEKVIVTDNSTETLRTVIEIGMLHPELLSKCSVVIRQVYINGATTGIWKVESLVGPSELIIGN